MNESKQVHEKAIQAIQHLKDLLAMDVDLNDEATQKERKRVRMKLSALSDLFESREDHKKSTGIIDKQKWIQTWRFKLVRDDPK